MIEVQIAETLHAQSLPFPAALLDAAGRQALDFAHLDRPAGLTIVVTDDAELQSLNAQFLGIDAPTDVLSFPDGEIDPDTQELYLGDVVISYPRALAQSAAAGHAVDVEVQLLVVHGVLHLLGYDHSEAQQKADMWAAQAAILENLGCPITSPSPASE